MSRLHTRTVRSQRIEIPSKPLRLFAVETERDLRTSVAQLETWLGRALPEGSRFHQALHTLGGLASTGRFAPHGERDGLAAIELALDALAISQALPQARVTDFRRDIEVCAAGPLVSAVGQFTAVQAQSQLIVRAALHRAGVVPSQPTHSGSRGRKKPDLLVENGTSTHPIEVKRPSNLRNVVPRAKEAAEQIKGVGVGGAIVVDITDCVRDATVDTIDDTILERAELVSSEFFVVGNGWRTGYAQVLTVGIMARPAWQIVDGPSGGPEIQIRNTSCFVAFGTAAGTIDHVRATWLRTRLEDGLNRLGISSSEQSLVMSEVKREF